MENARILIDYAVGQFGRDRIYKLTFGVSTPTVYVHEWDSSESLIGELWMKDGEPVLRRY